MSASLLDTLVNQSLVATAILLLAVVVGASVGALTQTFGKSVVRFLRGIRAASMIYPRKMQVLIVEDNPDSRRVLQRFLMHRDYRVAAAKNLRTGIRFLRKDRFDAIISDISLPDGTGYTLINEARRLGMEVLGIAMSGYPYPSNVNDPGVTGFDYHLTKPINCDDLTSLLKRAVPLREGN
jgi:CheY-like chemotaxis protein